MYDYGCECRGCYNDRLKESFAHNAVDGNLFAYVLFGAGIVSAHGHSSFHLMLTMLAVYFAVAIPIVIYHWIAAKELLMLIEASREYWVRDLGPVVPDNVTRLDDYRNKAA